MEAVRDKLMAAARRYAESLRSRPGVVGVMLYGSLASGDPPELTPFSDVDIALILDSEPPAHFVEHRLFENAAIDVLFYPIDTVRALITEPPQSLYAGGWLPQFLIKSFLLGREETILYDPDGELAQIKRTLNALTTIGSLALPDARRWLRETEADCLQPAVEQLREDALPAAIESAGGARRRMEWIALTLAATKRRDVAAERLGIPAFPAAANRLRQMQSPEASALETYRQAARALWDYTFAQVFQPAEAALRHAGVSDPARYELTGDYPLFWPGHRLQEFAWLIKEMELSLTWSRYEQEQGNLLEAQGILWPCSGERTVARCEGLAAALKDAGQDVSHIVTPVLEGAGFRRLAADVEESGAAMRPSAITSREAEQAVRLAQEMYGMLAAVVAEPPAS
jgi:predicted nucleotidyltransferase